MAEVRYRKVKLDEIMDNQGGNSKYSLKYINANSGEYPVYSAKTTGDMNKGYINTYDYDMECLQITTNGANAGTIIYREKTKFSLGSDSRIWYLKEDIGNISLRYIEIKLRSVFSSKDFSWTKKASLYRIKNIEFEIPVDENGNYDIEKQKEIVKKYEIVEEKKKELKEKLDYFKDVQVDFMATEISKYKEYRVSDIFDISLGDGKYTKTYSAQNVGEFPLYSGQTDGEYANINSYDYDGCYLTWAKDGLAGYIMHHDNEKFSITNHRGILLLKDKYSDLNLEFLKIILEPIFRKNIKGRLGTQEKNEYTTLSKEMIIGIKDKLKIPINKDGIFDLEKQNQIVSKYKAIEEMKKSILEKGLPFTLSNVQFDGETLYI